jgi:hypothetical protein
MVWQPMMKTTCMGPNCVIFSLRRCMIAWPSLYVKTQLYTQMDTACEMAVAGTSIG